MLTNVERPMIAGRKARAPREMLMMRSLTRPSRRGRAIKWEERKELEGRLCLDFQPRPSRRSVGRNGEVCGQLRSLATCACPRSAIGATVATPALVSRPGSRGRRGWTPRAGSMRFVESLLRRLYHRFGSRALAPAIAIPSVVSSAIAAEACVVVIARYGAVSLSDVLLFSVPPSW